MTFEDEFMDVQSGLISLCMEFTENKADKIYAYCSIEKKTRSFNACFECGGEVKTLSQMGVEMRQIVQFLRIGSSDLQKVCEVCERYNLPTPTEIKMVYDTKTGQFDADYRYDEVCSALTQRTAAEVFSEWVVDIKQCMT